MNSATLLATLVLTFSVASCGDSSVVQSVRAEDVEVALYVAIQDNDPRIVTSGATDQASLHGLYEISCREAALETWACAVWLDDESRVSCTIDRVRVGDDVQIDGRVHCKY